MGLFPVNCVGVFLGAGARRWIAAIIVAASLPALASCSVTPDVPEGCTPNLAQIYQPDPDGSGGGQVITVYTGYECEVDDIRVYPSENS